MSCELRTEPKDAISTLVSRKDLLAMLPTGFGKSLIFQILVLIKQTMTEKPSSAVVECLNCNLLNPENPDSGALLEFCRLYNLSQMVKAPTRVTAYTETLIDVILSSNEQQVRETTVKPWSISDHDIVCATLRVKKSTSKANYKELQTLQVRSISC